MTLRAAPHSPAHSGHQRWWRVGGNAAAAAAARVVSGLCQLALVPLLLGELGTESFGWAMSLVALVAMAQFADLGVALALQQSLSEAAARSDPAAIRRIYASGSRVLQRLGAAWLLLLLPLAWWLAPRALVAPPGIGSPGACWLLVAGAICLGLPLSAGTRLAAGLQLAWINALWTAALSVATVVGAWALARTGHGSPVVFIALLCISQIAPGWLTGLHLTKKLQWRGSVPVDAEEMRHLWRAGLPMAGAAVAGALVQGLAPAAAAHFGGYHASAAYSILQRLFGVAQQGHALLLGPLWPAYAEAAVRGETAWLRHTLAVSLALTAAVAVAVALVAASLPWLLPAWLGASAPVVAPSFAWLMVAAVVAGMVAQALSYLVLGLGRLPRVGRLIAAAHLATLALMAALGHRFGGTGVVAALALGTGLGLVPALARETLAALRPPLTVAPAAAHR